MEKIKQTNDNVEEKFFQDLGQAIYKVNLRSEVEGKVWVSRLLPNQDGSRHPTVKSIEQRQFRTQSTDR
jgi:hypothetical protein